MSLLRMVHFMSLAEISVTHLGKHRHSAHYLSAILDGQNILHRFNPLIRFEEFVYTGPVFQPSPHAGLLRITLLLPGSQGKMSVHAGSAVCSLSAGELLCVNAGTGIIYEENITPDTGKIHGISVLLNTTETLKEQPCHITKLIPCSDEHINLSGIETNFGRFTLQLITLSEKYLVNSTSGDNIYVYTVEGTIQIISEGATMLQTSDLFFARMLKNKLIEITPESEATIMVLTALPLPGIPVLLGEMVMTSLPAMNSLLERYRSGML